MRKVIIALLSLSMMTLIIGTAVAQGDGLIRLDPHGSYYPEAVLLTSPATFNVYVQSGCDAVDPHIFLVMTESSFDGLIGATPVKVEWNGGSFTLAKSDFTEASSNGDKLPPGTVPGAGYTVASLKDHLDTDGPIYWAFEPFLAGPITTTPQQFIVTLDSTDPRMMVYALGKCEGEELFTNRVPPTQPGFVIPEAATLLGAIASLTALGTFAIKRRKH